MRALILRSSLAWHCVLPVVCDVVCHRHRDAFRSVSVVDGSGADRRAGADRGVAGLAQSRRKPSRARSRMPRACDCCSEARAGLSGLRPVRREGGSARTILSDAAVRSEELALAIAVDHARRRGLDVAQAAFAELTDLRPVDRVRTRSTVIVRCIGSRSMTKRAPSSTSPRPPARSCGDTTRRERAMELCRQRRALDLSHRAAQPGQGAWNTTVWSLSLVGTDRGDRRKRARHHQGQSDSGGASSRRIKAGTNGIICSGLAA